MNLHKGAVDTPTLVPFFYINDQYVHFEVVWKIFLSIFQRVHLENFQDTPELYSNFIIYAVYVIIKYLYIISIC